MSAVAPDHRATLSPPRAAGFRLANLVLALAFALLALFAIRQVGSFDIGFHLKAGNHILSGHGWPRTDTFTFTVRDHAYIDTSWGYQVLVSLAERTGGAPGIVIFHLALLLTTFTLVWRTAGVMGGHPTAVAVFLLAGVIACEMRYEARPEILSLFFLALLLYILTRHAEGLRSPLWLLPAIQMIWANCHSFFVLGWAAMGVFVFGLLLSRRRFDWRLAKWSMASVALCFVNPYGFAGVAFPFALLTRFDRTNVFSNSIGELMSPFSLQLSTAMPFYPYWPIWTFRILAFVSLFSLWPLLRERRYASALLWLVFLGGTARMLRNMPLFVVATLPGTIRAFSSPTCWTVLPVRGGRARVARGLLLATCVIASLSIMLRTLSNAYYVDDRRGQRFGWDWNRMDLPVDAVEFVKRAGLKGRMFNHLNFGAFLMWAQPEPVFIDGRLEVIGEEFYGKYLDLFDKPQEFERAMRQFDVQWIVFPYMVAPKLLARLSTERAWRLAYYDHVAAIFVRDGTDASKYIDASLSKDAPSAPVKIDALPGFGGRSRSTGFRHWIRGFVIADPSVSKTFCCGVFQLFRGDLDRAAGDFADAIRATDGAFYEAYNNLASVLWRQNRREEARACYRIVLEDDPGNRLARERIGG